MKGITIKLLASLFTATLLMGCGKEKSGSILTSDTAIALDVIGLYDSSGTAAVDTKAFTYTTDNLYSLKVDCYFSDTHKLYFSDTFNKTGSQWKTSKPYYWPLGRDLDFVFRTETEAMDHYSYDPVNATGTFDYEACEFEDMKDMMLCVTLRRSQKNCKNGVIAVEMKHALCAVRFKAHETVPNEVIFNEVGVNDMYVKGICSFAGAVSDSDSTFTDINWKVSKLYKFDFFKNFSLGRVVDGMEGIDGLVVGTDIQPGYYLDRNQYSLDDTFLFIPDQKLTQINVQFYIGLQSRRFFDFDIDMERDKCYIFTFAVTPNDIYVVNSQVINWIQTPGNISQNVH